MEKKIIVRYGEEYKVDKWNELEPSGSWLEDIILFIDCISAISLF